MADVKKILVVDDHFEMLEFLRSMLELSSQEYEVLGVPSAEEGYLELRRIGFDLLITDVRLPGMSGFELVRRLKSVRSEMPIIMITAYSSAQGKQEAKDLGVFRYFQKPLDTDSLLAAVRTALYGTGGRAVPSTEEVVEAAPDEAPMAELQARLQGLRNDTGAAQVILADADGEVLFADGSDRGLDLAAVGKIVASNLESSFALAGELGSDAPLAMQYQTGETVDFYSVNVGQDYVVMLLFAVESRRGRIGTVWLFTQRAIKDLKALLAALAEEGSTVAREQAQAPASPAADVAPVPAAPDPMPDPEPEPERERGMDPAGGPDELAPPPVEEEAVPEEAGEPEPGKAMDDIFDQEEPLPTLEDADLPEAFSTAGETAIDLDAFWEEALSEEEVGNSDGLSFEEAVRQGLISAEFDGENDGDAQGEENG